MVPVWEKAEVFPVKGYSPVFCCFADDVNADGLPDVVTSNKKGVYSFEQVRK